MAGTGALGARPDYQRGLRNYESGLRNGFRPRRLQTAEGELQVQIRRSARPPSRFLEVVPARDELLRTEPLRRW